MAKNGEYLEIEIGEGRFTTQINIPMPIDQYKTKGLNQTEFRGLYTFAEQLKLDELEAKIEVIASLPNIPNMDAPASAIGIPISTWRQLFRSSFKGFAAAIGSGISLNNEEFLIALSAQAYSGVLDNENRPDQIRSGIPAKLLPE